MEAPSGVNTGLGGGWTGPGLWTGGLLAHLETCWPGEVRRVVTPVSRARCTSWVGEEEHSGQGVCWGGLG